MEVDKMINQILTIWFECQRCRLLFEVKTTIPRGAVVHHPPGGHCEHNHAVKVAYIWQETLD